MKKLLLSAFIVILVLGIVACSGDNSADTSSSDSSLVTESDVEDKDSIEVSKGVINVEITIPADLASDLTDEDVQKEVLDNGYKSGKLNADGSVTYAMSKSKHSEIMQEFDKAIMSYIDELIEDEKNSFTEVKIGKDYREFTIIVDSEKYSDWDSIYLLGFYMFGGLYQTFSGVNEEDLDLVIRMVDEKGEELYNESIKDAFGD